MSSAWFLKAELEQANAQIESLREVIRIKTEDYIKIGSQELFAKHPELETISWTQYTPYFMDGDTCYFSANTEYAEINGEEIEWDDDKKNQMEKDVEDFLDTLDHDTLEDLFGDHVKVTITKDGVNVEDYDHD